MQRLVNVFHREGASGLAAAMESRARSLPAGEIMVFADASKQRLAGTLPMWPVEVPEAPGTYGLVIGLGGGASMRVVVSHVTLPGGYHLLTGRESVLFQSFIERFWYGIAGAMVLVLGVGAAIGWLIRRALLSEVHEISRTAFAIANGDLSRRLVTRSGSPELDTLARTVNDMLARLASQNVQLEGEVAVRREAEQALHRAHDELGELVAQRTAELGRANESAQALRGTLRPRDGRLRRRLLGLERPDRRDVPVDADEGAARIRSRGALRRPRRLRRAGPVPPGRPRARLRGHRGDDRRNYGPLRHRLSGDPALRRDALGPRAREGVPGRAGARHPRGRIALRQHRPQARRGGLASKRGAVRARGRRFDRRDLGLGPAHRRDVPFRAGAATLWSRTGPDGPATHRVADGGRAASRRRRSAAGRGRGLSRGTSARVRRRVARAPPRRHLSLDPDPRPVRAGRCGASDSGSRLGKRHRQAEIRGERAAALGAALRTRDARRRSRFLGVDRRDGPLLRLAAPAGDGRLPSRDHVRRPVRLALADSLPPGGSRPMERGDCRSVRRQARPGRDGDARAPVRRNALGSSGRPVYSRRHGRRGALDGVGDRHHRAQASRGGAAALGGALRASDGRFGRGSLGLEHPDRRDVRFRARAGNVGAAGGPAAGAPLGNHGAGADARRRPRYHGRAGERRYPLGHLRTRLPGHPPARARCAGCARAARSTTTRTAPRCA